MRKLNAKRPALENQDNNNNNNNNNNNKNNDRARGAKASGPELALWVGAITTTKA